MISATGLHAGYGRLEALHGLDFDVGAGEVVAILGANGAGKTTLLRAVCGIVRPSQGRVIVDGTDVANRRHTMAERGIALVPEGRRLFADMTVEENLFMGAYAKGAWRDRHRRLADTFEILPVLADRRRARAASLSGGEQQMVAIGRALMLDPKILMLDEPSLGLAPLIVEQIYKLVMDLSRRGVTIVCVEQFVDKALSVADRIYVLDSGVKVFEGTPKAAQSDADIFRMYLGGAGNTDGPGSGRAKEFRDDNRKDES